MQLSVRGINLWLTRKSVKHMYLRISVEKGVCATIPHRVPMSDVINWIESRVDWIRRQQAVLFEHRVPQFERFESGEIDRYLGKPLLLCVQSPENGVETGKLKAGRPEIVLSEHAEVGFRITLSSGGYVDQEKRRRLIERWYRDALTPIVSHLIDQWQPIVGKPLAGWSIRKMKSRWGSCHIRQRKITLSLDLIRYPIECIEYVIVHELVHLHEPSHNRRFKRLMQYFLPGAEQAEHLLNRPF